MAKHSQHKSIGTNSKKAQRVLRAKARLEAFNKLSAVEKLIQMASNKADYRPNWQS